MVPFFASALATVVIYQNYNTANTLKIFNILYVLMRLIYLILLIITGFVLGCAICNIQDYFKVKKVGKFINVKIFAVHLATFILYMISEVFLFFFTAIYFLNNLEDHNKAYVWSTAFSSFCIFLSELFLCYIFWLFAAKDTKLLSKEKLKSSLLTKELK